MTVIVIMCIFFVLFLPVGYITYRAGYIVGWAKSDNLCEDEIAGLKKEIIWWKKQCTRAVNEVGKLQAENLVLKSDNLKKVEECNAYVSLLEKYDNRYWPFKERIEEAYKEQIITLYTKEGKTLKEIAESIGCCYSTVQRAVKKWGLKKGGR